MARQEALKQELKARKKELQDAKRRQRDNLKRQIRRAQSRISAAERKRRTRRLILIGSYLEAATASPLDRHRARPGIQIRRLSGAASRSATPDIKSRLRIFYTHLTRIFNLVFDIPTF